MKSGLPSGTVTFLFTDMAGSTRLLEEFGAEAYAQALAEHRRVLREAFARHDGVEIDTQGDAFFVAFPTAPAGVAAAADAQTSLGASPFQVRMGLHTGTPLLTEDGYVGLDVHRAARIAAAAHGGQVVVSAATRALVDDVELRYLGDHRFKDLVTPERVYQLGKGEFPQLRSLYRTNLPVPATPFLGRERELEEVTTHLGSDDVRLLTLTGTGGTGKTRLALQAAAAMAESFPDGITWVPLAALRDPGLVLTAVAQALDVKEEPAKAMVDIVAARLAGTRALVVLDNVEHLLPGVAAELARLRLADGVTLLVTSREQLGLQSEQVWPVPPLEEVDGVALFTERARALDPSFTATPEVDELCARLDHLPLALELAAARTPLFSPAQLVDRLAQRLDLLKGGRDAEPRHLTLRATIAWSYQLLDEEEQRLFRSLSIFASGFTYEAAEAVCGADPDTLQSLLEKSLARRGDTEVGPRYSMLETIRDFAAELLDESGETASARSRIIDAAVDFAVAAEPGWRTAEMQTWLRRFRLELDNLRQAIRWALEMGQEERALAICAYLAWLWQAAGLLREGFESTQLALARARGADPGLKGYGWLGLGVLAVDQGQQQAGERFLRRSLPLLAQGDRRHVYAFAHYALAHMLFAHDSREAGALLRRAETEARALGDRTLLGIVLAGLATYALRAGDRESARALSEEGLALLEDPAHRVGSVANLATLEFLEGEPRRARELLREARDLAERAELSQRLAFVQVRSAHVELVMGNAVEAAVYLGSARTEVEESGAERERAGLLLGEAALHELRGEREAAMETWRRAEALLQELGAEWEEEEHLVIDQLLKPVRWR